MTTDHPALAIDVLVFGGGIAGLWTRAHLSRFGYRVLLLENDAIGAGQTIASQGIIHGGIKYALTGEASQASRALAEMPGVWRACLEGTGEIDLRAATVLSRHQYLWTTPGLLSRVAALGASKVMRTGAERVTGDAVPAVFAQAPRGVDVYQVDEPVLDARSVVEVLAAVGGAARRLPSDGHVDFVTLNGLVRQVEVRAAGQSIVPKVVVFAAGAGNESLMRAAGLVPGEHGAPFQQIRPLHMVMMRGAPGPLFAHCLGASSVPRLTITSGAMLTGEGREWVWYIGGAIAENGVDRDSATQIEVCKKELRECLPWLDLARAQFATCRWDRAEGVVKRQTPPKRPDEPTIARVGGEKEGGNIIVGWPTKLAFAPAFAHRVAALINEMGVHPSGLAVASACDLPIAAVAQRPWENVQWT